MDPARLEAAVREAFRQADSEGLGIITKDGFKQLLHLLGLRDEKSVAYALDAALEPSRGVVNYHRFLDWAFLDNEASKPPPPLSSAKGGAGYKDVVHVGPDKTSSSTCAASKACPESARPVADGPLAAAWRQTLEREFGAEPVAIPDTAQRGITLRQLRRVLAFCERFCGQWHDTAAPELSATSGKPLDMGSLNLYHVNEWVVKPSTCERPCGTADSCALVELLAAGPQQPLWYVSHWWGEPVRQFASCLELQGAQRALGDDAPFWVCAYANRQHDLGSELSADPTESSFFRAMQLCRGVLLVVDPPAEQKEPATVFRRIWVQFEEAMTFRLAEKGDFLLDIVTVHEGQPQLLADGTTMLDESRKVLATAKKTNREKTFPIEIMEAALRVTMQEAVASNEDDRRRILNSVAGLPLDGPPPPSHGAFERNDRRLHALFAQAAWPHAAMKGLVSQMGLPEALAADVWRTRLSLDLSRCAAMADTAELARGLAGLRSLVQLSLFLGSCRKLESIDAVSDSISQLSSLEELDLHLGCCDQLRRVDRLGIGIGKLQSLKRVSIHLEGCSALTDFSELRRGLSQLSGLECLALFLHGCTGARNIGELGSALASKGALEVVNLVFAGCTQLTSVADFGHHLPSLRSLRSLKLNFSACDRLCSVDELGVGIAGLRGAPLEILSLGLSHCTGLLSFATLARGVGEAGGSLRNLSLWLKSCARAATGAAELARSLPLLAKLESLELCLADCRALPAADLRELVRALADLRPPARFELDLSGCAVPDQRLGRRFASHSEFCAEVAAVASKATA